MANGTDNPFACSIFDEESLNAALAFFKCNVEFEAFDGDGDAAKSFHVLAWRADNDDESAGTVFDFVEVADAAKAETCVWVEGVAGCGDVEAGVVCLPLPGSAGH